jgi:hypothetical protein
MDEKDLIFISNIFGVSPILINSSLVSCQNRERYYWTNIPGSGKNLFGEPFIEQPIDKKIKLQDILENGYVDRIKSRCLLESDSRPLSTPAKMEHRYKDTGFTTVVYFTPDCDYKKGIRYMTQNELERCQTVQNGYTKILKRNEAAGLLGDGWTVDVIVHLLNGIKNNS